MNARKKPAQVSKEATKKASKDASGKKGRGPREEDKARMSSPTVVDPINRGPNRVEGVAESGPPIVREPDEPDPKTTTTVIPIDRPDDDEEA